MSGTVVEQIQDAGVVGAGGAGFPTHVKLNCNPETLIVNGAECEPLLRVDYNLLLTEMEFLVKTLMTVKRALNPKKTFIAIKNKHQSIIERWESRLRRSQVEVFALGDFYPAGDEQLLVKEVTGKNVPPAGIPLDVGSVVINVETLYNIGNALRGYPVTEKYLTVAGAVKHPKTVKVPLGISFREVLELAGGVEAGQLVYIEGGPMMGKVIDSLDAPVTKTTKSILALPATLNFTQKMVASDRQVSKRAAGSCEICRICTDMCPRTQLGHKVRPHKVMRYFAYGGEAVVPEQFLGALLCVECGLCENYSCPTNIYPRRIMRQVKKGLIAGGVRYPKGEEVQQPVKEMEARRVPTKRLIARLGLTAYDKAAPLEDTTSACYPRVKLSLQPPFGKRCQPTVTQGQQVEKGQLLGEIDGGLGARVHASVSGTIVELTEEFIVIENKGAL